MASRRSHSVELATLAKYPFLLEASAFIRSEKVSLEEILLEPAYARARTLGKARVLDALERGPESERVAIAIADQRSEEHTSELQSQSNLVCRLLLEKKKKQR